MKRIRPFVRQPGIGVLCSTVALRNGQASFLTQSAVSHSMKALEDETGCQLFRRQGKKVCLTEAGDRLCVCSPILMEMDAVGPNWRD